MHDSLALPSWDVACVVGSVLKSGSGPYEG